VTWKLSKCWPAHHQARKLEEFSKISSQAADATCLPPRGPESGLSIALSTEEKCPKAMLRRPLRANRVEKLAPLVMRCSSLEKRLVRTAQETQSTLR
jgi:hypothetical protein